VQGEIVKIAKEKDFDPPSVNSAFRFDRLGFKDDEHATKKDNSPNAV